MTESQTRDCIEGQGSDTLHFEELDQRFHLKIRSFIQLCMPPIFSTLDRDYDLRGLRRDGVAPIMFFLQFESEPRALAFGGRVETPFQVRLHRATLPPAERSSPQQPDRLLLDMRIDVQAQAGSGNPLVVGEDAGEVVRAGRMRALHVLTRPVAPKGERVVAQVPAQLAALQEHTFPEPYPTLDGLRQVPEGFDKRETGHWREFRSVWGSSNTDINQHVNVHEYIRGAENHFARMLFGAGLPVEAHRIDRADILFRRPGFMGMAFGIRGSLHTRGSQTLLLAGVHRLTEAGGLDPVPSVFARMEGSFVEGPAPGH